MDKEVKTVDFVPLHVHSCFSILDGFASPETIAATAKQNGFRSIALTDHGSCAGLYRFYKACKKENIKPILGMETYFVNDINIRDQNEDKLHLTLLAKNKIGYKNLIKLSSIAYINGFYSKPRIDFNLLKQHHEGLICGSACIHGVIAFNVLNNKLDIAKEQLLKFKDLFHDDFFVEIMIHEYDDPKRKIEFRDVMKKVYDLAKENNMLTVATCDSHYPNKDDADAHDVLISVSTKDTIKNPKRFSFRSKDFYMKSYEELKEIFKKSPHLITNSLKIADKVEEDIIEIGKDLLPDFKLPPGETSEVEYLKSLIMDGMKTKGLHNKEEYVKRMSEELDVIIGCGFAKYFLILWDVIAFAKREKIRVGPGRGSGVASLCLYCLGITQLDPVKYNLLFSRFLNKNRVSPPDVDMDFDYMKQEKIFQYVRLKYGNECTTRIGTYHTLKAKDAIRRVCKALDIGDDFNEEQAKGEWKSGEKTLEIANAFCKTIPNLPDLTVDAITDKKKNKEHAKTQEFIDKYPDVIKYAKKIEKSISSAGVHPAGIIVCRDPIVEHVPLRVSNDVIHTQYDMKEVEELGLLKFDFLALKTLTLIDDCIALIEKRRGSKVPDLNTLEPNDTKIFAMLNAGDTEGVFQFEGWGITKLLQEVNVDSFEDMVVTNALFRPGVLNAGLHEDYCNYKHGKKDMEYVHPKMKDILKETFGIMIYQEQIMLVSMVIAGFSPVEADELRKGMGKKDKEKFVKLKDKFIKGCINHGTEESVAIKIFELCEYFSGYGFNRSHSAIYAFLAYQTAFLKCYFRIEFMCALLTSVMSSQDEEKRDKYEDSLNKRNIDLRPYDINLSKATYTIEGEDAIRRPLVAIKGIGDKAIMDIINNQPYKDIDDFLTKTHGTGVNKTVYNALVNSGCMGRWSGDKNKLLEHFETFKQNYAQKLKKEKKYKDFGPDII